MIQMERLSPQAMMVIANARAEAKRAGNQLIGSEHILLGIATTDDAGLLSLLSEFGLDENTLRSKTSEVVTTARSPHTRDDLDFTPRAQRLLSKCFDEAELLGEPLVQPKHILIALLREDYGIATRILERTSVNTTSLLKALLK